MKWISVSTGIVLEISIDAVIACCLRWNGYVKVNSLWKPWSMTIRQYKSTWLNPVIEEELLWKREIGNAHDTHALALRNIVGEIQKLLDVFHAKYLPALDMHSLIFVRQGSPASSILCIVKGNRQCSSDLPQDRWASIFSVRRIYYLCSNPTNLTDSIYISVRYCTCTKIKIGKKVGELLWFAKFAKVFSPSKFLLYGIRWWALLLSRW